MARTRSELPELPGLAAAPGQPTMALLTADVNDPPTGGKMAHLTAPGKLVRFGRCSCLRTCTVLHWYFYSNTCIIAALRVQMVPLTRLVYSVRLLIPVLRDIRLGWRRPGTA